MASSNPGENLKTVHSAVKAGTRQIELATVDGQGKIWSETFSAKREIEATKQIALQGIEAKWIQNEDDTFERKCEDLRQRIKQYYGKHFGHVSISQMNVPLDDCISKLFVTPNIQRIQTEKDGTTKQTKLHTYRGILYTGDTPSQRIILQGEAGKGKSTYVATLVLDWCQTCPPSPNATDQKTDFNDFEALQEYPFVFLIALRDSQKQREVAHMIKEQIIDRIYEDHERDKAYELLKRVMTDLNCFVVEDGLDEWADPQGQTALPVLLPCYDKCTVMTTTRYWKMTDERIKNSQIDCLLELKGINNSHELSEKVLRCLNTSQLRMKHQMLNEHIKKHSLLDLISLPALHKVIVCAWVDGIHLTGSRCDIYSTLLDFLLKKASNSIAYFNPPPAQCFVNTKHIQPNIDLVNALAETAFVQLFKLEKEHSIVFNETELSNFLTQEQKALALKAGILLERKSSTLTGSSTFSFIHKSLQEFLAAYHIARNVNVIQNIISTYLHTFPDAYLDTYQVLIFLCGQDIQAANELSLVIDEHNVLPVDNNGHCHWYPSIQESIQSGYNEARANNKSDEDIRLKLSCCMCFDSKSIDTLHMITRTNMSSYIRSLQINQPTSAPKSFKRGDFCVLDVSVFPNLERIRSNVVTPLLLSTLTGSEKLSCLFFELDFCEVVDLDMSPYQRLEIIHISKHRNSVSSESHTLVSDAFHVLVNLKSLTLRNINHEGLDLSACQQLETIHITAEYYGSPNKSYTLVADAFHVLVNLKSLTLTNISCDELDVSSCQQLETIHFSTEFLFLSHSLYGLVPDSLHTLVPDAFDVLVNLKSLALNNINHDGLDLSSCQQLETIHISREELTSSSSTSDDLVPDAFSVLLNLKSLTLNNVSCDGLDLSSCRQLETIHISKKTYMSSNTPYTLLSDAFGALVNLKHLTLYNISHDELNLSSCQQLETINIKRDRRSCDNSLTVVRDAFHVLESLKRLTLNNVSCKGLDLSACQHLERVFICGQVSLVPDACRGLVKLNDLTLNDISCDGLDLSSCQQLERVNISGKVSLVPDAFRTTVNLKDLTLYHISCEGLDLSSCQKLENVDIHGNVSLLAEAFRVLVNLKRLTFVTFMSGDRLDLSACPLLKHVDIRRNPVSRFP